MIHVSAPTFPLTREQFADGLAKGQGRARMHIERHGAMGMEDLIVDACLHNKAYDGQIESDRADALADLICDEVLERRVVTAVVEHLLSPPPDDWHWNVPHQLQLAMHLARRGHQAARDVLYRVFRRSDRGSIACYPDWLGAEQIIQLDGREGMLWIARQIAPSLRADRDLYPPTELVGTYDDKYGKGQARLVLTEASAGSRDVRYFRRRMQLAGAFAGDDDESTGGLHVLDDVRNPWLTFTGEEIIEWIKTNTTEERHWWKFRRWAASAPRLEIQKVVDDVHTCDDPEALRLLLGTIHSRDFPEVIPRIIGLADSEHKPLRWAAVHVLAEYSDSRVRQFAEVCLALRRLDSGELRLFTKNFQPGDAVRIEAALYVPADSDHLHRICADVLDVFGDNPVPESANCLLFTYQHTPCSNCRHSAVRLLLLANIAPVWVIEECRYDSDQATRNLIGA
ncbi:MAG: hypothetical protein FLDDKLPJ_00177 [Phycisphaerae bacterium]|nr:hypothetical protein [Phycisphaerae bacterium]